MGESFRKHSNPEFLKNSNFKTRLFQIVFLVVCLIHIIYGALPIVKYFQSRNWFVTEGEITSYKIEYDGEGASRPKVEYIFHFVNRQYRGNRYNFGGYIYNGFQQNRTYQNGQTVTIHFNPSNPRDNVLNREIETSAFLILIAGLGCCLMQFEFGGKHQRQTKATQAPQRENDIPETK